VKKVLLKVNSLRVELIHPNQPNSLDSHLDPPLGLLLIASSIRNSSDAKVVVTDLTDKEYFDANKIGVADVYGITVYAPTVDISKEIIKTCRLRNEKAVIVVGGAHPSAVPLDFTDIADFVVVGEGEKVMAKLVRSLELGVRLFQTNSISKILYGEKAKVFFPSYDLVDLKSYSRHIDGIKSVPIITSRGCSFSCSFCGLNYLHKLSGVRLFDEEIIQEHLSKIYGFSRDLFRLTGHLKALNIQDDIFTYNKKRLFNILNIIKTYGFKFRCMGRSGYDVEETYEKLAESGCTQVSWGIESGSQYMLDRMNKKCKISDNYDVIGWAKKYGINSRAFFVLFFPGETKETLEETKRFIEKSKPDQVFVSSMVPYPATDVYENPKKYGIIKLNKDYSQYYQVGKDGMGPILSFETEWLNRFEARELEIDFRDWIKNNVKFKGQIQDYEAKLVAV